MRNDTQPELSPVDAVPAKAGLSKERWSSACELLAGFCDEGTISSAALVAGRGSVVIQPQLFGKQSLTGEEPLRDDSMFLVASITKPIVASAALMLVERGLRSMSAGPAEPQIAADGTAAMPRNAILIYGLSGIIGLLGVYWLVERTLL